MPHLEQRPYVGLMPTVPVSAAGWRIEPPVSVAVAPRQRFAATAADVRLLRECVGAAIGVKASGGIRSLEDVRAMLDAGANRIGTSSTAQILGAL